MACQKTVCPQCSDNLLEKCVFFDQICPAFNPLRYDRLLKVRQVKNKISPSVRTICWKSALFSTKYAQHSSRWGGKCSQSTITTDLFSTLSAILLGAQKWSVTSNFSARTIGWLHLFFSFSVFSLTWAVPWEWWRRKGVVDRGSGEARRQAREKWIVLELWLEKVF